jgi:peptidyl-prolyl cis-trans isomerase C
MKRIAREPLVHFLALGALLFGLNAWRGDRGADAESAASINVTAAVIERLRAGYERQFGQAPAAEELRGLVNAHIREEVLCREALALGLDQDDSIVRQRLAQKMEFLTDDLVAAAEPAEAALQSYFTTNAARYARPARVSFSHVYFSREKRGAGVEAAAREALAEVTKSAGDADLGDAFLHGFEFAGREPQELSALFGPEFTAHLGSLPVLKWQGPVASSYGLHLVRVETRTETEPVTLAQVRMTVLRDFQEEQRRVANRDIFERLKQRYQITVDETAITNAPAVNLAGAGK